MWWLAGCSDLADEVSLRGIVTVAAGVEDPLGGASIVILDDEGALYDATTSSASGAFMVGAPFHATVFPEVSAPGWMVASFTGTSGASPGAFVDAGLVHGVTVDEGLGWRTAFAGCASSAEDAFAVGTLELLGAVDEVSGEPVRVSTGYVRMMDDQGYSLEACYLDANGAAYDPYALETGPSGTWGVFGLHEGVWQLTAGYTAFDEPVYEITWEVWVPADGVVPRFPLWLEFST